MIFYAFQTWLLSVLLGSVFCVVSLWAWTGEMNAILGLPLLCIVSLIISFPVFPVMIGMAHFAKKPNTAEVDHKRFLTLTPMPTVLALVIGFSLNGMIKELLILAPYQIATWGILAFRIYKYRKRS